MTAEELSQEVCGELDQMGIIVQELEALAEDVGGGPATRRDRAAAGAFLGSFYMGVENILKRTLRYHGIEVPRSERWHAELFSWFCASPKGKPELPVLLPNSLAAEMRPYRQFRHVMHHAYPIEFDWSKMEEGLRNASPVFEQFRGEVERYLQSLST